MADFFKQLQSLMLNEEKEHLATLIPYYETLWQHRDKLKDMLEEIDSYPEVDIQYIHDEEEYYTDRKIRILLYKERDNWMSQPDFYFEIELLFDERYWGYCYCKPSDEGYNEAKGCCGDGCDWVAPKVSVNRVDIVAYESFSGEERDMWKLEEKWNEDLTEHNERLKKERLQRLEEQLERTKQEIESIKDSK